MVAADLFGATVLSAIAGAVTTWGAGALSRTAVRVLAAFPADVLRFAILPP
jgi:hypothetical protein